jgi:hypothetical protein
MAAAVAMKRGVDCGWKDLDTGHTTDEKEEGMKKKQQQFAHGFLEKGLCALGRMEK